MVYSKNLNYSYLLLSFLPAALVIGPFIAEIIINIISIFFIYNLIKNKELKIFNTIFFKYFFTFYLFLIICFYSSPVLEKLHIGTIFYFRFFIFTIAAVYILRANKNNLKFLYQCLSITIFIVVIDGYIQFIFEKNILGFPKYREDRISGFFDSKLILGSYIFRLLPLLIGLTFFIKNTSKFFFYFNLILIIMSINLVLLSGERASFVLMALTILIIFVQINIHKKIKYFFIASVLLSTFFLFFFNQIIFDRYFNQFRNHLLGDNRNISKIYTHLPMFETAFKMFKENKLIGMGPQSYRYVCSDDKYVSYYNQPIVINNEIIEIKIPWNKIGEYKIKELYISKGKRINVGDKLFSYIFTYDGKTYDYFSEKEGLVNEIYPPINKIDNSYINEQIFASITPLLFPTRVITKKNACNTHPHNFYFQLLGETGIIGFLFIFILFVYLSFVIIKNIFSVHLCKKIFANNLEVCIASVLFVTLWPLTTTGNFFNNWLNIISFYLLAFYLFSIFKSKNVKKK
jgi:O-antigen ligase